MNNPSPIVSREEFDELKAMVQKLVQRVERLHPGDQVSEEHLAIMAAAFTSFLGKPVRVRSARVVGSTGSSWSHAGRSSLHAQRNHRRS